MYNQKTSYYNYSLHELYFLPLRFTFQWNDPKEICFNKKLHRQEHLSKIFHVGQL